MLRKGLAVAAMLLLPALLSAYTIVLKDGRRLEAKRGYVVEGDRVKFVGADGRTRELPLAEVDLAATERANAPPKRPKVWTNDDLERLSGAINVVGTVGATSAPAEAAREPEGEPAPGGEEAKKLPREQTPEYWQERLKPLREELTRVEQQLQQLRSGQGKAESNAVDLAGGNPGVQVEDTIRQLEARRTELQQKIAEIQLEAKRQGIPPGAVR